MPLSTELILRNSLVQMKNRSSFVRFFVFFGHFQADVAKLVDASDLGSGAARLGGSSPFIRTFFLRVRVESEVERRV